jgi:hypothetical protein
VRHVSGLGYAAPARVKSAGMSSFVFFNSNTRRPPGDHRGSVGRPSKPIIVLPKECSRVTASVMPSVQRTPRIRSMQSTNDKIARHEQAVHTERGAWGRPVRAILFGALALALAACNAKEAGEWKIEQRLDRVSDKPQYTVGLVARSHNRKAEQQHPTRLKLASLQLMCFDNAPVVRLHFTHDVGSNRNSRLNYRFDQNPGRDPSVRIMQDFQTMWPASSKSCARPSAWRYR